jgi:UDP-GlcNAc:undecaprenyl-phosphate GlcNAc-1-phosphate transferase
MLIIAAVAFALPFALSWLLTRSMIALAPRFGLVDHPSHRKVHVSPTPMGGGLAIYLAVLLTLVTVVGAAWLIDNFPAVANGAPAPAVAHAKGVLSRVGLLAMIVAAASVQMLIGLVDDLRPRGLSYQLRLGVEVLLVGGLLFHGVGLSLFTERWWISAPITILWIVGLTNALNFLDNMDGLSGGVAFWASGLFAIVSFLIGDLFVAGCFLVLMGAVLGFLRYNWNPAKIFMGDAGSNFLGFWMGVLTVVATFYRSELSHVTILAPLCILAVPIYDSTTVIVLRLSQGRSPFHPDKQHFSHRLVELGFRPKSAVLLIHLVTVTTGLSGVLLYFIPPTASWFAGPLVIGQVACICGVIGLLEVAAYRRSRRLTEQPQPAESAPAGTVAP